MASYNSYKRYSRFPTEVLGFTNPTIFVIHYLEQTGPIAMIVCHCQNISDRDIRSAVDWMRASDPETIITPGKIYHALGKRADCGGCMPLLLDTMRNCDSFGVARDPALPPTLVRMRARRLG